MKNHLKALCVALVVAAVAVWGFQYIMGSKLNYTSPTFATIEAMETNGVENFEFKDLQARTFQSTAFKNKIVILNFWASWCAPCIEEVPSLIKLVKEFKGEIQLIAISGDSNREDIDIFIKSFPEMLQQNIIVVWDENRSLMQKFQVLRLPESLVLGKDQKLVKKLVGTIDWYTPESISYMNSILQRP